MIANRKYHVQSQLKNIELLGSIKLYFSAAREVVWWLLPLWTGFNWLIDFSLFNLKWKIHIKALSHGKAAVAQGFLPHTLPHRMGLEPIYLWHLVALLPLPLLLLLPQSMNTHIGSNAFHCFAAVAAAPCERTLNLVDLCGGLPTKLWEQTLTLLQITDSVCNDKDSVWFASGFVWKSYKCV